MNETSRSMSTRAITNDDDNDYFLSSKRAGDFAFYRHSHGLTIADQLRHNTQHKKDERLRQYALDTLSSDNEELTAIESIEAQANRIHSLQRQLLYAKGHACNLNNLTESFLVLKRTLDRMVEMDKDDIQRIIIATLLTETALLIVLRSIESIVRMVIGGARNFPTLNSLISYIRSCHTKFPVHGQLLVEWHKAAQVLDLLIDDPDWLVQPGKAHWAIHLCNETLSWTRIVFNEDYHKASTGRPILDREDSVFSFKSVGKE